MRNKPSLQTVLMALPIASASLYVFGACFYRGFMRTLGLEETQFPITVDRTLFHGFFVLLDLSSAQIGYFVLASGIITFVAFLIIILSTSSIVSTSGNWLTKKLGRSSFGNWFSKKLGRNKNSPMESPREIADFADFSVRMMSFAMIVLVLILGIWLIGVCADKSGQTAANSFLKGVKEGKHIPVDIFLSDQEQPIEAHTILCSITHCAFIIGKNAVTYRLEKIEKIIRRNIVLNTVSE